MHSIYKRMRRVQTEGNYHLKYEIFHYVPGTLPVFLYTELNCRPVRHRQWQVAGSSFLILSVSGYRYRTASAASSTGHSATPPGSSQKNKINLP